MAKRYQRDNQKTPIEGQTIQWPKEKGQKNMKMAHKALYKKLKIVQHKFH